MKNTTYSFIFAVSILFIGATQSYAQVISDSSTDDAQDAVAAPVVTADTSSDADQDSSAGVTSDSSTDAAQDGTAGVNSNSSSDAAQDGAAGVYSNPSSDLDQDGPAGVTSNPSTDTDQDGPVVTPPNNNGGGSNPTNTGSGSSSNSNRTSGGSFIGVSPIILGASTTSCPLITDYLKLGGSNNPAQVINLQIFLKGSEKADVTVNGIFDQKTEDAVKDFQKKYLSDILGPWDATRSTGFVYITTTKKINQLACAQPLVLTAEERAIIAAYNARGTDGQSVDSEVGTTGTSTVGSADGETVGGNDNVAAVGGASILSRFWNFIKNLFR